MRRLLFVAFSVLLHACSPEPSTPSPPQSTAPDASVRGPLDGNWWNASVRSECRGFAGRYLSALRTGAPDWLDAESIGWLGEQYGNIAARLRDVSDNARAPAARRALVAEARDLDAAGIERLERLRSAPCAPNLAG